MKLGCSGRELLLARLPCPCLVQHRPETLQVQLQVDKIWMALQHR
jgi:hypothetical protein